MDRSKQFSLLAQYGIVPFKVGTIFHPIDRRNVLRPCRAHSAVEVSQPTRLNAMLLDYSQFTKRDTWWRAGSVAFGVDLPWRVSIRCKGAPGSLCVVGGVARPAIIRHTVEIMRKALDVDDGLEIELSEYPKFTHVGLGSTPSIQTAIAAGLNGLFGDPIPANVLLPYLIRNYGEEIRDDSTMLLPVQAMGAAAAVGLAGGGLVVVAGPATVIARIAVPDEFRFVIGLASSGPKQDAAEALADDAVSYSVLRDLDSRVPLEVAYDVLNSLLPAMARSSMDDIGDVIEKLRLSPAQLRRYSMRYPDRAASLFELASRRKELGISVLSVTSTGPTIFALTREPERAKDSFEQLGYNAIVCAANNVGLERKFED